MRARRIHVCVLVLLMTATLGVEHGLAGERGEATTDPGGCATSCTTPAGSRTGCASAWPSRWARPPRRPWPRARATALPALENVQMNGDTDPPLPQDEAGIAVNLEDR